jgi:manganese-transporting P-type ATPase
LNFNFKLQQMTAQGILTTISFIALSRSKPLDRLSPVRPLTSIFAPALFLSILGQFALHLATMMIGAIRTHAVLSSDTHTRTYLKYIYYTQR